MKFHEKNCGTEILRGSGGSSRRVKLGRLTLFQVECVESQSNVISVIALDMARADHSQAESGINRVWSIRANSLRLKILPLCY